MLRQPIITIMGHIDSGKTTFLDKIKGTSICQKEFGKITQHIGATEITIDVINAVCGNLLDTYKFNLKIPGLLFIDTPGHSAFDNLRERGGSLADLVVLVVDVNKGLQVQDIETLNILKMYKVPFIVAANKIDLISGWYQETCDVSSNFNKQSKKTQEVVDEKIYKIVGQLFNHGFQSERFDRVDDFKKTVAIIPICAEKSWGLPETLLFLAGLSQKFLEKKLELDKEKKAQATVLEVGEVKGIGAAADIILYQGSLNIKDEIVFPTKQGLETTKIKALLKINILTAVDKKKQDFLRVSKVEAASGLKIVAPGINNCLPGGVIVSAEDKEAIEHIKSRTFNCFSNVLDHGALVKADTLGSLEALTKLLEKNNICVAKADVGEICQKDITELKILHEKNNKEGVLFLFNTKIKKEFEDELIKLKMPIFKNNIIYKLIEDYQEWFAKQNKLEKDKLMSEIIYPCSFKILPDCIFRSSKPAVVGVRILEGRLVCGARVVRNDKIIGDVVEIQDSGKKIIEANKEQEVAISLKGASYLKDFKEKEILNVFLSYDMIKKLEEIEDELSPKELELIKEIKIKLNQEINN